MNRRSIITDVLDVIREMGIGWTFNIVNIQEKMPYASEGAIAAAIHALEREGRIKHIGKKKREGGRKCKHYCATSEINAARKNRVVSRPKGSGVGRSWSNSENKVEKIADRCSDFEDRMLGNLADTFSYMRLLEERVNNPDLTQVDEKLLWAEIKRRREAEGKKTGG